MAIGMVEAIYKLQYFIFLSMKKHGGDAKNTGKRQGILSCSERSNTADCIVPLQLSIILTCNSFVIKRRKGSLQECWMPFTNYNFLSMKNREKATNSNTENRAGGLSFKERE